MTTNETNPNQQKFEYNGVEIPMTDLEKDIAAADLEAKKSSRFRQIVDGKYASLTFTGRIFKRVSTGTDETGTPYSSNKIDFELTELVTEGPAAGKNKFFSIGEKNKVAKEIMANIRNGIKTMQIARRGQNKATKYIISVPE